MRQDELVDFLSSLDKKYVDSLIDIITDNGAGRVALDSAVKDFLVSEKNSELKTHYKGTIKVLLNEFYQFGSNSLMNVVRSLTAKIKSVDYYEILNDIYELFISKENKLSCEQKEQEILLFVLGKEWQQISFEDVQKKSKEIDIKFGISSDKKSKTFTNIASKFSTFVFTRINPAIAAGDAIRQISSPALRIIVPFTIQLMWLKNKSQDLKPIFSASQPIKKNGIEKNINQQESKKDDHISKGSQLLNNTTGVITSMELASGNYLQCTVNPELLASVKDNPGLLRGVIVENGKIVEHAKFFKPENLEKIVASGVLFNALSTVVAQKHLADINNKLSSIQDGIDDILKDIEFTEQGRINDAIKNLEKVSKISDIKNNQVVLNRLQDDAKNLSMLYETLFLKIKDNIQNITYIDITDKKIKQVFIKIHKLVEKYDACIKILLSIYTILFYATKNELFYQDMEGLKQHINDFNGLLNNVKEKDSLLHSNNLKLANEAFLENRKQDFQYVYNGLETELKLVNREYTLALAIENNEVIECKLVE